MSLGSWQYRTEYSVSKTELSLQDLAVNLDEITELQDSSVFKLQPGKLVPEKSDENLVYGIYILMDFDLTVI